MKGIKQQTAERRDECVEGKTEGEGEKAIEAIGIIQSIDNTDEEQGD